MGSPIDLEPEAQLVSRAVSDLARRTRFPVVFGGLERDGAVHVSSIVGARTRSIEGLVVQPGRGLGGAAMLEKRPRLALDYRTARTITHDYDRAILGEGISTLFAVPILVAGRPRGSVYCGSWTPGPVGDLVTRPAFQAAESIGVARWATDTASAYAKIREQFGRPIGAFQAVQHRAADIRLGIEATSLLVWSGLWRLAHGHDAIRTSLMAAWQASEAGERASKDAVQLHGGVGFIKEYPLHHFYRRTKAQRLRFGPTRDVLRELGGAVLTAARSGDFRAQFVDWPESAE